MSYKVLISSTFKRKAKPLLKKYPSLKIELSKLGETLSEDPVYGTSLGNNCYKIRLAIHSKGVGKRGGARVITYIVTEGEQVVLLTIYDKANKADLNPEELAEILNDLSF